jgi:hypothetical protein
LSHSTEYSGVPLVATAGTLYKDPQEIRFELAIATANEFQHAGIPFIVVDASPEAWATKALSNAGALVLPVEIGGIATQRQQGVRFAAENGATKVLGQEPEKTLMPYFAEQVSKALDTVDVLVVGRTEVGEKSLPPVQRRTEHLAGWILEQSHGLPADALCGPRGFSVEGMQELQDYPALEPKMNNWIYLYHTTLAAREAGLKIGGIAVDLIYPEAMVAEETDNPGFDGKRYDQFRVQLDYMLRRDDVRPEAIAIARKVLGGFDALPEKPTTEQYLEYFDQLEQALLVEGYKSPNQKSL